MCIDLHDSSCVSVGSHQLPETCRCECEWLLSRVINWLLVFNRRLQLKRPRSSHRKQKEGGEIYFPTSSAVTASCSAVVLSVGQ